MASDDTRGILGISLIDDQLRIVEGERRNNELQITRVAHGRVRQPFTFEVFSDKNMPRRFADDITRLCDTQLFEVKQASFSLDSRMVLIKKIPVDKSIDENALPDHIIWEVRQFAISPIKEYIVDFEHLDGGDDNGSLDYLLVVVVRKRVVEFLKQMFRHTSLNLQFIDVDIFSAQRALLLNYDYVTAAKIGLIDIEEKKVNFAILQGRNFCLSHDAAITIANHNEDNWKDSAVRMIAKELRRVILDHQLGRGVEDLSEIFLYGEAVEDGIVEGLQNSYDVRIDRANPFKKVKLTPELREKLNQQRSERFMISLGAALRGIQ
jgi:Tfp pilus assembly PilM family ATPase